MSDNKKDIHANVGFSISSNPDRTEISKPGPKPSTPKSEMPFRLVLVSDLAPGIPARDWSTGDHVQAVDRNSFAAFMEKIAPTVAIDVENRLRTQPRRLEISLRFRKLADFKPAGIVGLVPELSALWQIRDLLASVGKGTLSMDEFKSKLEKLGIDPAWSAELFAQLAGSESKPASPRGHTSGRTPESTEGTSALDHLFQMVDVGTPDTPPAADQAPPAQEPQSVVGAFAAAAGAGDAVNAEGARRIMRDIEDRVSLQVQAIMDDDRVRSVEGRWRALKFLVDSIDFRSNVRLDVISVGDEAMAEALHYQMVLPEHEGRAETPASLVVYDRAFGNAQAEMELLAEIAGVAESIQTPAIAGVSPAFWERESAEELSELPVIWQHLQGPEYIHWNNFTDTGAAAHVALAMPPFLLRDPYDGKDARDGLAFREARRLWGAAPVAAAAVMTRRFCEAGWPTLFTGSGEHGLEERPFWTSNKGPIPLSAAFNSEKQGQLADEGFTVLACVPGKDQITLCPAPTTIRDRRFEDEEATKQARTLRNLESQLFISRIVHFLLRVQDELPAGITPDKAVYIAEARLQSLMGISAHSDAGRYASVQAPGSTTGARRLKVSIQSPPSVLADPVTFSAEILLGE